MTNSSYGISITDFSSNATVCKVSTTETPSSS